MAKRKPDPGCICHGNWRLIVEETEPFLDHEFVNEDGKRFILSGVVHGSDDYYYLMIEIGTGKAHQFSCCGNLETFRFTPVYGPLRKPWGLLDLDADGSSP